MMSRVIPPGCKPFGASDRYWIQRQLETRAFALKCRMETEGNRQQFTEKSLSRGGFGAKMRGEKSGSDRSHMVNQNPIVTWGARGRS